MKSSIETGVLEQGGTSRQPVPAINTDLLTKAMAFLEMKYGREHRGIYALVKPLLDSWQMQTLDLAALDEDARAAILEYVQSRA